MGYLFGTPAEAWTQFISRDSYTLNNLFARVTANTRDGATTVRTRIGGANGNLSVSIGAGATGVFEDTVNSDSLVDGNLFNYQVALGGASGAVTFTIISCVPQTASNNTPILGTTHVGMYMPAGTTRYAPICGYWNSTTTEARTYYTFRASSILSNLRVYVQSNGITAASTVRVRRNGANGNLSVTIPDSISGAFEDAVNTDSISVGDEVNLQFVPGATGTGLVINTSQVKSNSTGRQTGCADVATVSLAFGLTRYLVLEGSSQNLSATEADTQVTMRISGVGRNLFVNVPTNSLDGSTTFRTRVNGTDGNLSVNVGAGATGLFEDTTNADNLVATDSYNYQVVTGGTSGSIQICVDGFEFQQPAAPAAATFGLHPAVVALT